MVKKVFPKNFLWGNSTSSMQTDVAVKKGDKESQFMTFIEQKVAVQLRYRYR